MATFESNEQLREESLKLLIENEQLRKQLLTNEITSRARSLELEEAHYARREKSDIVIMKEMREQREVLTAILKHLDAGGKFSG